MVDVKDITKEPEVADAGTGDFSASTVDESPEKSVNASPEKISALPSKFNFGPIKMV